MKFKAIGAAVLAAAVALGLASASEAAAPTPTSFTPELIKAATAEGKVVFYTSVELKLGEDLAKLFQEKYPGISVQVERTGSERVFQRIGQEYSSNIHNVDVVNSSDASHFIYWRDHGMLAPFLSAEMASEYPATAFDADGTYASWRVTLSPFAYNTKLVKEADAPKSFKDLLDPKWKGRLVKASPNYSGTIMTSTFETLEALGGWSYFEALAKQDVLQTQSATEPPRKVASGERDVMVDGSEYFVYALIDQGNPLKIVYPAEGVPMITSPAAILKDAPHPNAARLFYAFVFSAPLQQVMVDKGGTRSLNKQVKDRADHTPLTSLKVWPEDAKAVEAKSDEIKKRYRQLFGG
ncbi:MAG: ABC transporter substrate-binding protein [Acidobacteriota bacterium]